MLCKGKSIFFTYTSTLVKKELIIYEMSDNKEFVLKELPLCVDVETKAVLKSLPKAHAALAELKGDSTVMS